MTNPIDSTMNCEQFADALPDLLERDVDETSRARLEGHAVACGECGPMLADLRKLRIDAANLPPLVPSRDLWAGIAARIETPVVEIAPGGALEPWNRTTVKRRRLTPLWTGLAAAGLVAITATVTHRMTMSSIAVPPAVTASVPSVRNGVSPGAAAPSSADTTPSSSPVSGPLPAAPSSTQPSVSLVSNRPSAEETFDGEIKRLRIIVAARRSTLDSATVGVIEKNLKVIDDAIAQCREALRRDPASRFLIESLNDALDTKVQLLRTAAMLPARS